MHLVLQDELLGLGDGGVGFALAVLDDQLHLGARKGAAGLLEIHVEAVDHVLADLRQDAGRRRDHADAQFLGRIGNRGDSERDAAAQHQRHKPP